MKKKKTRNTFKKIVREAHLYLGLLSGLVVFIIAITGCLWAFQEEINELTSTIPPIEQKDQPIIPPMQAKILAQEVFPGRHVHGTLYEAENDPVKVIFYEYEPEFYYTVYLHPYTGKVLETENNLTGFFPFVLEGHQYLWLPKTIGSEIVRWGASIFALMLISGIILWWPHNRKAKKQRFTLNWKKNTKWKRKNYDLHAVAGFYVSILALVIVFTGLVMAFEAFKATVYASLGGEKEVEWRVPENPSGPEVTKQDIASIDKLFYRMKKEFPKAEELEFHYPTTASEAIYVEVGYSDGIFYDADYRFYDTNTLKELASPTLYGIYEESGFPEKVMRMNYDIHVGAIGGFPGKLIAFFASLICASLPVTGFIMWYGRNFKKKQSPIVNIASKKEVIHS